MERVKCDLCGSEDYTVKFEIEVSEKSFRFYRYARNIPDKKLMTGLQTIVECNQCQLNYTNPRFSTEELNVVYSSERIIGGHWKNFKYLFDASQPDVFTSAKKKTSYNAQLYQWKFDILNKYLVPNNGKTKLLDIGCGDGKFVSDAIKRGFDAKGIDLSPDRIAKGKELYDLDDTQLQCINVGDFSANEKFDVIVMWDVIEHVESPSTLLNSIKAISHPKTKIFVLTMSMNSITYKLFKQYWNYINPTQHLYYFSHKTMENMFKKCNFNLLGVEMDDSKNKKTIHLLYRILIGQINYFFFKIYTKKSFLRTIFKPFHRGISYERMEKRIENLYPGRYLGRYHDNFVFVGELSDEKE